MLSDAEKQELISQIISTPEGRKRLAAAMVQPWRGPREYPVIGEGELEIFNRTEIHKSLIPRR